MLLLPPGIFVLAAGQTIEHARFDAMDKLSRFAARWNEVIPAAGREAVRRKLQYSRGDRVAMMMIVEKPAVEAACAQFLLNGLDVGHVFSRKLRAWPALCALYQKRVHLAGRDSLNLNSFDAAFLAGGDSNSGKRYVQTRREKSAKRFVGAIFGWRRS